MNIFYVSNDPTECAQALDSLRLNKMMIESIQMLSTAAHEVINYLDIDHPVVQGMKSIHRFNLGRVKFDHIQKLATPTHKNHPCTVWCGSSKEHYEWLVSLTDAIHVEWLYRGHRPHKCYVNRMPAIRSILNVYLQDLSNGFTPPPNCSMYEDRDVFVAYKKTLVTKWAKDKRPPTWENRGEPHWRTTIQESISLCPKTTANLP